MVKVKIDGREISAKEGMTILEVAREHDISIPALCYYEEVSPGGRCRLCAVEIVSPEKKHPIVLACVHPVEEGLEVRTESEKTMASRRSALEVLLSRAPHAEVIRRMAQDLRMKEPAESEGSGCLLCGLCVRVCKEVVGRTAIRLEANEIKVTTERCIGCGTCAYLCPSRFIKMEDHEGFRIIWKKGFRVREHLISGRFCGPLDMTDGMEKHKKP